MADTIKDKLSSAAKSVSDSAKEYYGKAKAALAPIDQSTLSSLAEKQKTINSVAQKPQPAPSQQAKPNSYKKGGKVKKGGMAKVHKGERVLTTKQSKQFEKKGGLGKLYGK